MTHRPSFKDNCYEWKAETELSWWKGATDACQSWQHVAKKQSWNDVQLHCFVKHFQLSGKTLTNVTNMAKPGIDLLMILINILCIEVLFEWITTLAAI